MRTQSVPARISLTIVLLLAGWIGGRALQRTIDTIPDSNDDFIFF